VKKNLISFSKQIKPLYVKNLKDLQSLVKVMAHALLFSRQQRECAEKKIVRRGRETFDEEKLYESF
jgi:hypothetical protein